MVAFDNLRLTGFKSFVEPTDMGILPGLTGIVGPNGCGKSNLVEALRWVMGESSARRLRGGEMDDVIFAGAAGRPPRNQAEVTLRLANPDLDAPVLFNDATVLEVTRKVVRGQGSAYRVNGRDHRAQDLKLLFADLASGAASNAMVAQGRVAAIVNARPTDRRALLEEAAGITGLYARRREAENRLRAAEQNLERVADMQQNKQAHRRSLDRQASAARRYSKLQEQRRALAAAIAYLNWLAIEADLSKANRALAQVESDCERLQLAETSAKREEDEASSAIEPLRVSHAEASSRIQRLDLALEALSTEEKGLVAKRADLARQLAECGDDLAREQEHAEAAAERLAALETEEADLKTRRQSASPRITALQTELTESETAERQSSDTLRDTATKLSTARNERLTLEARISSLQARTTALQNKLQGLRQSQPFAGLDAAGIDALIAEQTTAQQTLANLQGDVATNQQARADAEEALKAAQEAVRAAEQSLGTAKAEADGLTSLLERQRREGQGQTQGQGQTLSQVLEVATGFGPQVAAALADGLAAHIAPDEVRNPLGSPDDLDILKNSSGGAASQSASPSAPKSGDTGAGDLDCWRPHSLPPAPPLPGGIASLAAAIVHPDWLKPLLAYVGVAETAEQARALQPKLHPGQALTTPRGGLWRWDGFIAAQDRSAAQASLIAHGQRLKTLQSELPTLQQACAAAAQRLADRQGQVQDLSRKIKDQEATGRNLQSTLTKLTQSIAAAQRALADHRARIASQEAEQAGTARELETVEGELRGLIQTQGGQDGLEALEIQVKEAQARHEAAQQKVREHRETLELAKRDLISVEARLGAILTESFTFEGQHKNALGQLQVLKTRAATLEQEGLTLSARPEVLAQQREELSGKRAAAHRAQSDAGDALAEAEHKIRHLRQTAQAAVNVFAEARESRARLQAEQGAVQERLADSARQAYETFKRPASDLLELTDAETVEALPSRKDAEREQQKLERQLDAMGPVNLTAETELKDLEQELSDIEREVGELTKAINKLRRVIGELNQEGRLRLKTAFDQVATHFSALFQRLFGGGKARVELVGSDDPLEAGLEIFASPPGKRLQSLTLLSGGEQTLTALALIFAMFRANPAPLCVLDEVDAPLDDANVNRMCGLLEDMAAEVGTRFLIVTHNALTMARVDRLFGVTMAERGVSKLVSVDLAEAEQYQGS